MTDISTIWDVERAQGDWILAGAGLQSGNDLATAVLISLFTDRVAEPSDPLPDRTEDRRGWWGDFVADVPIGSRLWLLDRSKLTPAVALAAKGYAEECLAWLVSDGAAIAVQVEAAIVKPSGLRLTVTISRADGSNEALSFNWAWAQLA